MLRVDPRLRGARTRLKPPIFGNDDDRRSGNGTPAIPAGHLDKPFGRTQETLLRKHERIVRAQISQCGDIQMPVFRDQVDPFHRAFGYSGIYPTDGIRGDPGNLRLGIKIQEKTYRSEFKDTRPSIRDHPALLGTPRHIGQRPAQGTAAYFKRFEKPAVVFRRFMENQAQPARIHLRAHIGEWGNPIHGRRRCALARFLRTMHIDGCTGYIL